MKLSSDAHIYGTTSKTLYSVMSTALEDWSEREYPAVDLLEGQHCRLEEFANEHADSLFESTVMQGADDRFRYLPEYANPSREEFDAWFLAKKESRDPKYYAIVDKATGKVGGRQTFMSIRPEHGVAEIGHIHYSPLISKTTISTEGMFLMLQYLFDTLKYRPCEWYGSLTLTSLIIFGNRVIILLYALNLTL